MTLRKLVLPLLLTLVVSAQPSAQPPASIIPELADSSALVVVGRVTSVGVQGDAGSIYTYASVEVSEVLKGQLETSTMVVKQLGGTLRDIGLYISDQATFRPGEQVLLFMAVRPRDNTLYTAGLERGKWLLVPDLVAGGPAAVFDGQRLVLDAAIRATISSSRPHPQDFVPLPPELQIARPAFTFIPENEGGPARWHEADDGRRIPIDFQNVPGGLPGNGVSQLDGAIGTWNAVNTTLDLVRGGSGDATCPASSFTGNGRIALYWNDPCGEVGDGDSSTFGVGGGFFTPGFQKTVNGVVFNKFLQGLAILNNTGPHLTTTACLQDAVTHVLGHAVGLGHSSNGGAVMFPTLRNGCTSGATGVASDDTAGLRAIYPAMPSGGSAPGAPTAITGTATLDTVTLSWTPATTGGAPQGYTLEAGSAPGLANIAILPLNGTATSTVVGAVPSGVYYVRVRARNVLGTSGPSPDTVVNVGPCAAPSAPTGLAYTAADNLVTLFWNAPASGVTQGYWLFAGYGPGQSNALVQPLGAATAVQAVAPFGNYYARVAARNSCATGPTTADILVSVMPCTAAPSAPTGLTFTRSGNLVTLSWIGPTTGQLPSRYRILAGSAPGVADLLVHDTANNAPTFLASAPPGTYFVRVQGLNNCGGSAASNEIQVVVP